MKHFFNLLRITTLLFVAAITCTARAEVFTNDTTIAPNNSVYDGQDLVVSNCVLTVDGPHVFASLLVGNGGVLTHSFWPSGSSSNVLFVVHEAQTLTDTNIVTLVNSNVLTGTVLVTDVGATVTYTNDLDYLMIDLGGGQTGLQRTTNSTIPDGATVWVSYDFVAAVWTSGLNLTVTGNVEVVEEAAINAKGRGYGGNLGTGNGGETGSPSSGAGAGHGGFGGNSSSNAVGGTCYGVFDQPTTLGSGGGQGAGGPGGNGGGGIKLVVSGNMSVEGSISANGDDATNSRSGGGAGGSIWIIAQTFSGAGTITANGGAGEPIHGGGGGGGRVAIQAETNDFAGVLTAFGGNGAKIGGAGTVYTKLTTQTGLLVLDNGNRVGTNSLVSLTNNTDVLIRGNAGVIPAGTGTVGNLTIASNGVMTVVYPSTLNLTSVSSVTIQAGGAILADAAGFAGGSGNGPGRYSTFSPFYPCGGAGHGGSGANGSVSNAYGGITYDSQTSPTSPGSGGGTYLPYSTGGAGGGAIRLNVAGTLLLDGRISANGGNGSGTGGGGGSGGSIWVTTGTLAGAGSFSANGGTGATAVGGGGGGGRIGVFPATNSFTGAMTAYGGGGTNWGGAGTVFIQALIPQLILDNAGHLGTNTLLQSASSTDLIVRNGAIGYTATSSSFASLFVGSNSWLAPSIQSQPTTITFYVNGNATLEAGGGILTDAAGYRAGQGPGAGGYTPNYYINYPCSGAGHGGYGANSIASMAPYYGYGGNAYDSTTSPSAPGSGGGTYSSYSIGGAGGGAMLLTVNGTLQVDGRISANADNGSGAGGGGGSGGAIRLTVGKLSGAGSITANGGDGVGLIGGGGGGGRIAISCTTNAFAGIVSAYGGGGANRGGAGTIFLTTLQQSSTQLLMDNAGNTGTNTSFSVGGVDVIVAGGAIGQFSGGANLKSLVIRSNSQLTVSSLVSLQTLFISGNATIDAGGALSVDGKGYSGGQGTGVGYIGVTSPLVASGGGGHGGYGAANPAGYGGAYGLIQSPTTAGSGGGGPSSESVPRGGAGGGALQLSVTGTLTVNGRLSANGKDGNVSGGGGAGGSLWLPVGTLTGSGLISANGGAGAGIAGGGGGGRIYITYNANTFSGGLTAFGGSGGIAGGAGTIYTKANNTSVGPLLIHNGGQIGTNTPLSSSYSLPTSPFNLTINGGATVLPLTPLPLLSNLTVGAGSAIVTRTNETNVTIAVIRDVNIAAGGAINVDGKGFSRTNGPGGGASISGKGAGGGYGGAGGVSASGALGGTSYGSASQPVDRGSGGGAGANTYTGGSEGGGAIRLSVGGTLNVAGSLTANGNSGLQDDSGGGSGGSIWVSAKALIGSGNFFARGGDGELFGGGGGGGGRIAIYSPSNTFTGFASVAGGGGANVGQPGTYFLSGLTGFQVASQSPTGVVSNAVSSVDLNFNEVVTPGSVSTADFVLVTPSGPLAQASLSTSVPGLSTVRVSFPAQNLVGDYRLEAGPNIQDIFGQPLSQVYTGAFTVLLPTISGTVTNASGQPVAGVVLMASGLYYAATTDVSGNYSLGVPPGWTGTVAPALGTNMFVPGTRNYSNVTDSITNENFLMLSTIAPTLGTGVTGTNLFINWQGFAGLTYQLYWSTNLATTNWYPSGGSISGTNDLMQLLIPLGNEPQIYFRLRAQN